MAVDDPLNVGQPYAGPLKLILFVKPLKYPKELVIIALSKPGPIVLYKEHGLMTSTGYLWINTYLYHSFLSDPGEFKGIGD